MGIVTLEDILEELVGEIWDEYDEDERDFVPLDENTFEISGDLRVSDLIEELNIDGLTIETSSNSVGGWALERLGHIPKAGESFTNGILKVTVKEVIENRIMRLTVQILPPQKKKTAVKKKVFPDNGFVVFKVNKKHCYIHLKRLKH